MSAMVVCSPSSSSLWSSSLSSLPLATPSGTASAGGLAFLLLLVLVLVLVLAPPQQHAPVRVRAPAVRGVAWARQAQPPTSLLLWRVKPFQGSRKG
jgi:hypothetical protein